MSAHPDARRAWLAAGCPHADNEAGALRRQRRPSAHGRAPGRGPVRTWPHQERAHDADARAVARADDVKAAQRGLAGDGQVEHARARRRGLVVREKEPDGVARGRVRREGAGHAGALACHLGRALAWLSAA